MPNTSTQSTTSSSELILSYLGKVLFQIVGVQINVHAVGHFCHVIRSSRLQRTSSTTAATLTHTDARHIDCAGAELENFGGGGVGRRAKRFSVVYEGRRRAAVISCRMQPSPQQNVFLLNCGGVRTASYQREKTINRLQEISEMLVGLFIKNNAVIQTLRIGVSDNNYYLLIISIYHGPRLKICLIQSYQYLITVLLLMYTVWKHSYNNIYNINNNVSPIDLLYEQTIC